MNDALPILSQRGAMICGGIVEALSGQQKIVFCGRSMPRAVQEPFCKLGDSRAVFRSSCYAPDSFSLLQTHHAANCQAPHEEVLVTEQFR